MRITFVLPGHGAVPVGGFKVVYEYANGLARKGHTVTVVHASQASLNPSAYRRVRGLLKYVAFATGYRGGYKPDSWFRIDPRINMLWVPSLGERWIPDSHAVVATAWRTAEWVATLPPEKGRKYYLIQHKESIFPNADPVRVTETWKLPMHKIVIAKWLQEEAEKLGQPATYVPNGLDFVTFGLDVPIDERQHAQLMMLCHDAEWKGTDDGIEAMLLVAREVPQIRATLFGVGKSPKNLPKWITYRRNPQQNELRALYNQAAIFVSPSLAEGWGLPPCEAMQCGAAVCATDIGGHREYAIHEETALLSPPSDPGALAQNVVRLVRDQDLRIRIAQQGYRHIQQFTWEKAVGKMEETLLSGVKR